MIKTGYKNRMHWMMALCCGVLLTACSVTRHIPAGSYLVNRVRIQVEREGHLSKNERIKRKQLEPFVRQHPAGRFLGLNLPLWIYNMANPEKNNWWNRAKRKMGSPPVLLDSALTQRSAQAMKIYMEGKGFLGAGASFRIDTSHKKARITYVAMPGQPYRIGKINYNFRDPSLRSIILSDTLSTLIHSGDLFDANVLDDERVRITTFLKNRGYYNFSINNLSYVADSTAADRKVNLTMVIKRYVAGYTDEGEMTLDDNRICRIRDIFVFPDYNPVVAISDSLYTSRLDTIEYKGLKIVYDTRSGVRSEILRRTIGLYTNYLYNSSEVKRTYDNIMRLGYYKSASILFSEVEQPEHAGGQVTYIGENPGHMADTTDLSYGTEEYLDCNILCIPALRQSYSLDLEGTASADYFGITATVGYQNNNLFRGMEQLDLKLRGGYEFMRAQEKRNSFELGLSAGFSIPRLITPFPVNRYNRAVNPRTKVEFSYSMQRRPYYQRTLFRGIWGYIWGMGRNNSFVLRPIDVNIINMRDVDSAFLSQLKNPYLIHSYTSQLVAGLSGSYIFNNQHGLEQYSALSLRVNFETNGNLIDGLSRLFDVPVTANHYRKVFGIRYAQYFRIDLNMAKKFVLGPKSSIVYRLYGGWGYAYGNSAAYSIPFERLFYCGGSNSMRGWLARTLGPGDVPRIVSTYPSQLANFKLETNLEGRFPVWGILQGALFFDVGNIWFMNQGGSSDQNTFRVNRFFSQLGFNTGLGARFDFNFFIFRIDWGIKLHNPNDPSGKRWIQNFRLANTTLNFGVGYPF